MERVLQIVSIFVIYLALLNQFFFIPWQLI